MNFAEIENLRLETATLLQRLSGMPRIILLNYFYSKLLSTNDLVLVEAFCFEFLNDYLHCYEQYNPQFSNPAKSQEYIDTLTKLSELSTLQDFDSEIKEAKEIVIARTNSFVETLKSNSTIIHSQGELYFPLIGSITICDEILYYSSIEKVKIKITASKNKDTFVFIPSKSDKEQLSKQAEISFELAKSFIKDHRHKLAKHHEVLVYFENLNAEYDGNSLGIALTIGFIEQLSFLYNLPYITHIKGNVVSTGGVNETGEILLVGKSIIEQKIHAFFYSSFGTIVIPKHDEIKAINKLEELKQSFFNRKIKLIAVENIEDILARRNLIDFKKQSPLIRSARSIKKNWVASASVLILLLTLILIYIRDYDDNPSNYEVKGQYILINNRSGKVLWQKQMTFDPKYINFIDRYLPYMIRILDINSDGKNEVLLSGEKFQENENYEINRTSMYDHKGKLIWKYKFSDDVSSQREDLNTVYGDARIIDIIEKDREKMIYVFNCNGPSFSSAIYKLNARTGVRVEGTLWNAGHIIDALAHNIDDDSAQELIYTFTNNGIGLSGVAVIDLENADGQGPTSNQYLINGKKIAKFKGYILVPQTDYSILSKSARGSLAFCTTIVKDNDRGIYFGTNEVNVDYGHGIGYCLDYNLIDFTVTPDDRFATVRDLAIKEGKLKPPFTDTKEFRELIKSQILYWNGKEFAYRR